MKKLFLLLFMVTSFSQAQTYQNPTFGTVTTKTSPTVTDDPYITTTGTTGTQGKIAPVNLLIPYTPVNYSLPTQTIGNHLAGIDTRLGQISTTSAGITQRVYFTADNTTVNSVVYFSSSLSGKGSTATGSPPALVLADNTKAFFTKDVISIAQPSPTIGYAGTYSGNLTVSATPTPVATQQRFTVEIYRTDNLGTPIASGVSGAPTGDLGVTVLAILDSGIINLSAGSITNVPVSGILTQNVTINTGERLRYHVSAAKIGSGGGNVTFGVYYGNAYNSYYDVPVAITTDAVLNKSGVTGITSSDALNALNANSINKTADAQTKIGGFTSGGVVMAKPNDNWIALGTSVTAGGAYTTPMSNQLKLNVINLGVSSSTSADLVNHYADIPTLTTDNKDSYRLISIEHGINDAATSVPLSTYRNNLVNAILHIKSKNWPNNKILIINGNYCSSSVLIPVQEAYADEAMKIAKEQGIQYSDTYNYTKINGAGSLLVDGVHPTTAGGKVYARGVIASMQGGGEFSSGITFGSGIKGLSDIDIDGDQNLSGNFTIGFNKAIKYLGAYTNSIIPSTNTGTMEFAAGYGNSSSNIDFFVSNGVTNLKALALRILNNRNISVPSGNVQLAGGNSIGVFSPYINNIIPSDTGGSLSINNGFSSGTIDFNVSNGVTNAKSLALRILNNRSIYIPNGDIQIEGNRSIGFFSTFTNTISPAISNGSMEFSVGRADSSANIDFYTPNGVTNAKNLALRIRNDGSVVIAGTAGFYVADINSGYIGFSTNTSGVGTNRPALFRQSDRLGLKGSITNNNPVLIDTDALSAIRTIKVQDKDGIISLTLGTFTVATLPTPTGTAFAVVTDATAPTYLGALTGGGSVVCPVFYNGTAWVAH